ncbi:hypothetical protein KW795_00865, partial [Candidatus Microgenomates bacterium]|nr:hypothetical protein [Candidatus Microgenomates bacterium]
GRIKIYHDVYVDKAHSNILESFATTGLVGLSSYIILLFVIGLTLFNRYRIQKDDWNKLLFFVFLMYLYHSQTNITSIAEEIVFWFIVGTLLIIKV